MKKLIYLLIMSLAIVGCKERINSPGDLSSNPSDSLNDGNYTLMLDSAIRRCNGGNISKDGYTYGYFETGTFLNGEEVIVDVFYDMVETHYEWENCKWIKRNSHQYGYNENGNLIYDNSYSYSYDNNGNITSKVSRDDIDKWDYSYDNNGNLTSYVYYIWEGYWVGKYKYDYTYDDNNLNTSMITSHGGIVWHNFSKYEYTYDDKGNITSETKYKWEKEKWVSSSKYVISNTYDSNGNLTSYVEYFMENGELVYDRKHEYTYDGNGNKTSSFYYHWKDDAWAGNSGAEYTYDGNGNQTSIACYLWKDSEWVISQKDENTYDDNGNITSDVHYYWKDGEWVYSRGEYTYDDNGNITTSILFGEINGVVKSDTITYYYSPRRWVKKIIEPISAPMRHENIPVPSDAHESILM